VTRGFSRARSPSPDVAGHEAGASCANDAAAEMRVGVPQGHVDSPVVHAWCGEWSFGRQYFRMPCGAAQSAPDAELVSRPGVEEQNKFEYASVDVLAPTSSRCAMSRPLVDVLVHTVATAHTGSRLPTGSASSSARLHHRDRRAECLIAQCKPSNDRRPSRILGSKNPPVAFPPVASWPRVRRHPGLGLARYRPAGLGDQRVRHPPSATRCRHLPDRRAPAAVSSATTGQRPALRTYPRSTEMQA